MDFALADEPLIGREAELTRILTALEAASTGHGRMVLLSGEPGIGKTRLAREVLARAGRLGARACAGRSFEQHTAVPFFPFTEALTRPLGGPPLLPDAGALERWPDLARLLPDASAETPIRDGHETQLQMFRAVTAFLRALADVNPLAMLLDDLHWADATSLSLLLYLGRHLADVRVLIMGTYREVEVDRQHPLAEAARELVRERLADEVTVRRLALDGTAELTRAHLGGANVSKELVALVHGRAEGNPFFTEELIKALVERGLIVQVEGTWIAQAGEVEVPRSVRAVVGQRLGRLAPDIQELMQLASVVGQEFDLDVVLAASGLTESVVLDALDAALAAGLVEEQRGGASEGYRFAHALIQQTLYEELPGHRRRRLHRRIGEAVEALGARRAGLAAELARHFRAAGDLDRALGYSIEAGDRAAVRYAHAEAARHFQVALDRLVEIGDSARAADVQFRLAGELADQNQLADALAAYQASLGTFERLGDITGQARVHWGIGLVHRGRYDIASAVSQFEAALRLWPPEREDAELASLLLDATRASLFSADSAAATGSLATRALEVAERCDDPGLLTTSLILVAATGMLDDPRPSATVAPLHRAERLARAADDWRALSFVCLARADWYELSGELDRALADRRAALEAAERCGDTERLAFAYQVFAETQLILGAWEEGRVAAGNGLGLDPQGLLKGMPGRALLTWMGGRDALTQMAAYAADARQRGDLQGLSRSLAAFADMALQIGRPTDAEAPAREAADLLRVPGGWRPLPGVGCGPLAETVVRVAAPDAAEILSAAERQLAMTEQYVARPQLLRARGLWLGQQGALQTALEALRESAIVARSQGARIQLGRTLDELTALARRAGDVDRAAEADAELRQLVASIGPQVGALAWARRVRKAARTSPLFARGRSSDGQLDVVTPREREVAGLVARGLTNRQIAEELVIAEGTAGVHVDHILSKLGFRSRAQVAAWAAEHGLLAQR